MVNFQQKEHYDVYDLKRLVAVLRSPEGCPWDREQTHESICRNFIEETYEAIEALQEDDKAHIQEELGDVLTQVVFHAGIEEDAGVFDLDDVADGVCKKLIFRHPHVFGDTVAKTSGQVLKTWDKVKMEEKHQKTVGDTLEAVAKNLPGLWRSEKILKRAADAGFTWNDIDGALDKLREETEEVTRAAAGEGNLEEELGDLLLAAVSVGRFGGIDPEVALHKACDKYIARFKAMEGKVLEQGKDLHGMSLDEMVKIYTEVKSGESGT